MERAHLSILSLEARTAAENMAIDLSMSQALGPWTPAVLRFYDWAQPSMSFGYFQPWSSIGKVIERVEENLDVVRRPTGGGLVDHRKSLTYALVLARGSTFSERKTTCLYESIHVALSAALNHLGGNTLLSTRNPQGPSALTCFEKPVMSDVIDAESGIKIAGSAIRRSRDYILIQGSVAPLALSSPPATGDLAHTFASQLSNRLGVTEINRISLSTLNVSKDAVERFSSSLWTHRR